MTGSKLNESLDDRTLRLIGQLTKSGREHFAKWAEIPGRIAIVTSNTSMKNVNARLALAMSINCLARVEPIVTSIDVVIPEDISYEINAPLFDGHDIKTNITSFTNKLRPKVGIRITSHLDDDYDALLSIGNTDIGHSFKVSIASDGWLVYASPGSVSEFTDNINPVGAYMAANLGSVEVFKKVFVKKADLINPEKSEYDFRWNTKQLQRELVFNTFDYSIDKRNSYNPTIPEIINVEELVTVGIGAGGGACIYTLASFSEIQGKLQLIDSDEVKVSNLNRYIYATRLDADINKPKVDVMKEILSIHRKCIVDPKHIPYKKFSEKLQSKPVELIISTVDNRDTRIDIQWDLPRIILDAAAAGTLFHINRIEFGNNACLGCRFYQDSSSDSIETKLSKVIGLSREVISKLRANNSPIENSHINSMKPFSEKYNFPLPNAGEHFQDWFLYHCGKINVNGKVDVQIPVPFATVMPGILLAGEVVKYRHFKDYDVRDFFSYDVFSIKADPLKTIKKRIDCPICSNQGTIDRYKEKYNIQS